ncbi:MAG: hypothetical protein H0W21_02605 [Actinobacteria bacterium]|nr:hypothetical protein [Actinomycetota bacterium]
MRSFVCCAVRGEPQPGPEFTFELIEISGEEGRELRLEQARAIRDLLLWARFRTSTDRQGRGDRSLTR